MATREYMNELAERIIQGNYTKPMSDGQPFSMRTVAGALLDAVRVNDERDSFVETLDIFEKENKRAGESNYVKATFTKEEVIRELNNQIIQIREEVARRLAEKMKARSK